MTFPPMHKKKPIYPSEEKEIEKNVIHISPQHTPPPLCNNYPYTLQYILYLNMITYSFFLHSFAHSVYRNFGSTVCAYTKYQKHMR